MAGPVELAPGVHAVDHTADVGIEVRARSLGELFHRAAIGMLALVWEGVAPSAGGSGGVEKARGIALESDDVAMLLAGWLRELLYLCEAEGVRYHAADFEELDERRLRARVRGLPATEPPVRELKGVTYHALEVACWHGEWHARVIFDV